ncbi:hypothetical protein QQ045_018055 [Rhodiola kirilowii]
METRARLDRALANASCRRMFPNAKVTHVPTSTSDHDLLLIDLIVYVRGNMANSFKYEPMWLRRNDFVEIVSDAWERSGDDSQPLANRLRECGQLINKWNKQVFGNVQRRIKDLKAKLESIRELSRSDGMVAEEAKIAAELDEWRLREELLWRQRSRAEWLSEGDRNTNFFHARASYRRKANRIDKLRNEEGEWLTEESAIACQIRKYFGSLFKSTTEGDQIDWNRYLTEVNCKVSQEAADKLCEPVTEVEIKEAVFQMSPTKAPGPDGFSAIFYQKHWHVVRGTITAKVSQFFRDGIIEEGLNETMIVLIPKCKRPRRVEYFRPISLCNVFVKIITKILANLLRIVLPVVVSEAQSAFIPGRQISDNILLAHEVLHFIKTRRKQKKGYFSLKLDMSKAYDRIEWRFLEEMLLKLGFPAKWISLTMECVRSVRYTVKFNNQVLDIPRPERGLRQG